MSIRSCVSLLARRKGPDRSVHKTHIIRTHTKTVGVTTVRQGDVSQNRHRDVVVHKSTDMHRRHVTRIQWIPVDSSGVTTRKPYMGGCSPSASTFYSRVLTLTPRRTKHRKSTPNQRRTSRVRSRLDGRYILSQTRCGRNHRLEGRREDAGWNPVSSFRKPDF